MGTPRFYKNKRLLGSVILPTEVGKSLNFNKKAEDNKSSSNEGTHNGEFISNQVPSSEVSYRITMGTWHPKENTFAVARHNSLFLYSEKRSSTVGSSDKKMRTD